MDAILHATFTTCNHDVYPQDVYMSDNQRMGNDYKRLLKAAEELKGWSGPTEVATGLTRAGYEVTPQKMTNWKSRGVSKEGRLNASRIIGCRPHWIESGDGPMLDNQQPDLANTEPGPILQGLIPLISWVHAGAFCKVVDLFEPGDAEEWLPAVQKLGPRSYALRVKGDSMTSPYGRSYPEGCIIFVDPDAALTNGARVIAKLPDLDEATFKTYSEDAGQRYLKPLNPQYPTIAMTPGMMICGVVRGSYLPE